MNKIIEKIGSYSHAPERENSDTHSRDYIECRIATCTHVNKLDWGVRQKDRTNIGPRWVYEQAHSANNPVYKMYYDRAVDYDSCKRIGGDVGVPNIGTRLRYNPYTTWLVE